MSHVVPTAMIRATFPVCNIDFNRIHKTEGAHFRVSISLVIQIKFGRSVANELNSEVVWLYFLRYDSQYSYVIIYIYICIYIIYTYIS